LFVNFIIDISDTVVTAPVIVQPPMDIMVPVTTVAMFTCTGRGYGDVIVTWEKTRNDRPNPISNSATFDIITEPDLITSTITIPSVIRNDRGRYQCIFNNSEGETISESARLAIGSK